jgi:hypothetical protein
MGPRPGPPVTGLRRGGGGLDFQTWESNEPPSAITREQPIRRVPFLNTGCYDCGVFNFGNPKTPGQWVGHVLVAMIGLFLIWWMLRIYVH